jgi:hypothetical protein
LRLSALNMQFFFWFVSNFDHVKFEINEKYYKKMTIQIIMLHLWSFKHTKIQF